MSSYDTKAYKNIQEAKKLLNEAYELLTEVLSKNTQGHSDMKDLYVGRVRKAAADIYEVEKTL